MLPGVRALFFVLAGAPASFSVMPMREQFEKKLGCGCPYCGVAMGRYDEFTPSRDHIIPRSRGGTLEDDNKAIVCKPCNADKADLTILEFYLELVGNSDPRASHVARFINGMNLYFAGRLRIPHVPREVRRTYPRKGFNLRKFMAPSLAPDLEQEERMAPSFGM
jgi:hypothetical protein